MKSAWVRDLDGDTAEKGAQSLYCVGHGFGTGMLFHASGTALPEFKGF